MWGPSTASIFAVSTLPDTLRFSCHATRNIHAMPTHLAVAPPHGIALAQMHTPAVILPCLPVSSFPASPMPSRSLGHWCSQASARNLPSPLVSSSNRKSSSRPPRSSTWYTSRRPQNYTFWLLFKSFSLGQSRHAIAFPHCCARSTPVLGSDNLTNEPDGDHACPPIPALLVRLSSQATSLFLHSPPPISIPPTHLTSVPGSRSTPPNPQTSAQPYTS